MEVCQQKVVTGKEGNEFEFATKTVYFVEVAISFLKAFTYASEDSSVIGSGVYSLRDIVMCAVLFSKLVAQ